MTITVREYEPSDEQGWVRCRTLAFLDTAYYDDVHRSKEHYESPAIELVAESDGAVVGLLDIELDTEALRVTSDDAPAGGMLWHVAVHPDHQRKGIARDMLATASEMARRNGAARIEAWTRDDRWVQQWYEHLGFVRRATYLHVYADADETAIASSTPGLRPQRLFAHFVGDADARTEVARRFRRTHECVRYDLPLAVD